MDNSRRKPEAGQDMPPFSRSSGTSLGALRTLLKACEGDDSLKRSYVLARRFRELTRKSCNYDMTSQCNLYCEGCFYFEGDGQKELKEKTGIEDWERFFKFQAEKKGIGYGYFAGAEPALAQDRLVMASRYIKRGSISTNGTIRIDTDLPYTILISVWGDEKETTKFRGGGTFWKAIRNFAGDPRARFIYTVNRNNIGSVNKVAKILDAEGACFSFNYYSPTDSYLKKIRNFTGNDKDFFRLSNPAYYMHFLPDDLRRAHETISEMIEKYPETCLHTKELNEWMMSGKDRYKIDESSGIATNCGGRNSEWHQAYGVDQKPLAAKCCTPNVDCRECRLYAPALSTALFRQNDYVASMDDFRAWLSLCEQWGKLFLTDTDEAWNTDDVFGQAHFPAESISGAC